MDALARGRNLVRLGLLVVTAVVVFGGMFLWLTERGLNRNASDLYVRLPSADRLKRGDPVLFRGVPVGEVKALTFDRDAVVVRTRLRRRVPLGSDAFASLEAVDVFGGQSVVLTSGAGSARPALDRDTIPGTASPGLTARMEELGSHAMRLVNDTTVELVYGSLASVSDAGVELKRTLATANALMATQSTDLARTTSSLAATALEHATAGDDLRATFANLELATANLVAVTERTARASSSLESILAKLDQGAGTAGLLVNDPTLHDRLLAATTDLDSLIRDIRQNPGRYIRFSVF
jgi:phospholipid/cholesterol/gamma-HCH transport system substrate-binding protein